jgi:hypothetical protein
MSEISKKFENLLLSYNKKLVASGFLIPTKVPEGILLGNVLIKSNNNLKTVTSDRIEYKDIFLNLAAIKIANLTALRRGKDQVEKIYQLDQEYGKYFIESQYLLSIHSKYINYKDYEKADTVWAKYQEVRDRAEVAKIKVERFLNIDK